MLTSPEYPGLTYDQHTGSFFRDSKQLYKDDLGFIQYLCSSRHKIIRKKALILSWIFLYGAVPKGNIVYPKDLNPDNNRGNNLGCLPKQEYLKIKDALLNTNGAIRLVPHPVDVWVYILKYRENGKVKTKVQQDVIEGLKNKRKIMLKNLKILSKYMKTR
jgi:hypothetical protein